MSVQERIKNVFFYKTTLWDMAVAQLKTRYASSVLGIGWAVITPFLTMLAITFVFVIVFKVEIKDFPFFVLAGIFPWNFFSSAVSDATLSFPNYKNILHQFNLPREIIPLSYVLSNFLNFLIGWVIIYPIFLFLNPKIIFLFPFLLIILMVQFLFICGLGLILSIVNVFFRDMSQILGILLMLWFWVTPIFYTLEMVPEKFRWMINLNPLTSYIIYYRFIVFSGVLPGIHSLFYVIFWSFVSLLTGFWLFARVESRLLKWI